MEQHLVDKPWLASLLYTSLELFNLLALWNISRYTFLRGSYLRYAEVDGTLEHEKGSTLHGLVTSAVKRVLVRNACILGLGYWAGFPRTAFSLLLGCFLLGSAVFLLVVNLPLLLRYWILSNPGCGAKGQLTLPIWMASAQEIASSMGLASLLIMIWLLTGSLLCLGASITYAIESLSTWATQHQNGGFGKRWQKNASNPTELIFEEE